MVIQRVGPARNVVAGETIVYPSGATLKVIDVVDGDPLRIIGVYRTHPTLSSHWFVTSECSPSCMVTVIV